MGKFTKLNTGGSLKKLENKTVAVLFQDGSKPSARGTLASVWHTNQSPMMKISLDGQKNNESSINRNRLEWLKVEGFAERDKLELPGWASQIRLNQTCYSQHLPPAFLDGLTDDKPSFTNPYKTKGSNFCVVRHPYERLISQFTFADVYNFRHRDGSEIHCSREHLNKYLLGRLGQVRIGDLGIDDCHFIPQSLFVYGYDVETGRADRQRKWCDHVLHFETADTDFNQLMKRFGYGLELHKAPANPMHDPNETCSQLTASDLSPEVRALADFFYREDFELFGYKAAISGAA